jgi:hypothetical protein
MYFRHLVVNEAGEYSFGLNVNREMEKGEGTSCINQSLKELIDAVGSWRVSWLYVNPWVKKLMLSKRC